MKKKEPFVFYSLYGTIIGSIIIAFIVIGILGGMTTLLCYVLLPILIVYLSFKFLPQLWASIIFAGLIVIGIHSLAGMWRFTIAFAVYFALMIIAEYVIKNKKRLGIMMMTISILFFVTMIMLINLHTIDRWLNTPEITEKNMQDAVEIIEDREDVLSASIGIDEDHFDEEEFIYIVLDVADSLTRDQKIYVGENSATVLNTVMSEENDKESGELYHYYDLEISVGISEPLHGSKRIDSNEIQWAPPLEW